jgi:hypothetical protein
MHTHPAAAKAHILPRPVLLRAVEKSWSTLWGAKIGTLPLTAMRLDAQVVGKFFQELMALELYAEDPRWRSAQTPAEKDFVFEGDDSQSFELKMCGQVGGRQVFGNRCSAPGYASADGKTRDGWLLTINYSGTTLNVIRFGWILGDDWVGQRAASGNASKLRREAYERKLQIVPGEYQLRASALILPRLGKALAREGVATVGEAAQRGHPEALRFIASQYYV